MVKAEVFWLAKLDPVFARSLQHVEGPSDIGLDEISRTVDRPVDMRLRSQVHNDVGLMDGKNFVQCSLVANISLLERIQRAVCHRCQIREASGIGQRIKVDDRMAAGHRQTDHG